MNRVCWVALATVIVSVLGCAAPSLLAEETVGEHFRRVLAEIDDFCRVHRMGPYLDIRDPEYRKKRRGTDCDILKLRPRDWRTEKMVALEGRPFPIPARWLVTPGGHFAHSIHLPTPYDVVRSIYRPGENGREYFERLCSAEAGEFVIRAIDGVHGVGIARPPQIHPRGYSDLVFHTNEWSGIGIPNSARVLLENRALRYSFVEQRLQESAARSGDAKYRRLSLQPTGQGGGRKKFRLVESLESKSSAMYWVTWRGIRRPQDWEHGIYGQEVIVYQVRPFDVLGFKRTFTRYEPFEGAKDRRHVLPRPCPQDMGKLFSAAEKFVGRVLIPARDDKGAIR